MHFRRSELYEKRIHELSEEMEDQIRQDREKIMELESKTFVKGGIYSWGPFYQEMANFTLQIF